MKFFETFMQYTRNVSNTQCNLFTFSIWYCRMACRFSINRTMLSVHGNLLVLENSLIFDLRIHVFARL